MFIKNSVLYVASALIFLSGSAPLAAATRLTGRQAEDFMARTPPEKMTADYRIKRSSDFSKGTGVGHYVLINPMGGPIRQFERSNGEIVFKLYPAGDSFEDTGPYASPLEAASYAQTHSLAPFVLLRKDKTPAAILYRAAGMPVRYHIRPGRTTLMIRPGLTAYPDPLNSSVYRDYNVPRRNKSDEIPHKL